MFDHARPTANLKDTPPRLLRRALAQPTGRSVAQVTRLSLFVIAGSWFRTCEKTYLYFLTYLVEGSVYFPISLVYDHFRLNTNMLIIFVMLSLSAVTK